MSRERPIILKEVKDRRYIDNLTSLYNRKFFDDHLKKALVNAMAENIFFTLLLIDVDDFSHFNEMNGYELGDKVLQQLGFLLKRNLRGGDFAVRFDGEEFLIVLVNTSKDDAFRVAERLRKMVESYQFPGEQIQPDGRLTVSLGLASFPEDGESIAFLLKRADTALFQAKQRMKNRVEVFTL